MKNFFLIFCTALSFHASANCTITPNEQVDLGGVSFGTDPEDTAVTVSYDVTCPEGKSFEVYPRANTFSAAVSNSGSSNGTIYMYFSQLDGTLMKTSTGRISGIGTGEAITVFARAHITKSSSTITQPVDRVGAFSNSAQLMQVRMDNGAITIAQAQVFSGQVYASCSIEGGSDIDFGVMPIASGERQFIQYSTLRIQCNSGLNYSIFADIDDGQNPWVSSDLRPVAGESKISMIIAVKESASQAYTKISNAFSKNYTGSSQPQDYDLRATLIVGAKAAGAFNFILRPRIKF